MENFWRNTGVQLGKHWKLVIAGVIAITAVLAIGLTQVEFATGEDSYLNPDSQVAIDNRVYQGNFGGDPVIMLFTASAGSDVDVTDLATPTNLAEFVRLDSELKAIGDNISAVITPMVSLQFSDALLKGPGRTALLTAGTRDDEAGAAIRSADIGVSLARLGAVDDQTLGNPDWNDLLVYGNDGFTNDGELVAPADDERVIRLSLAGTFPDSQTAVGGVVMRGNLDLDTQSATTEQILDILATANIEGFDLTVTGSPVYLKEINDYLKGGMLTLGLAAFVVMAIVLAVMFRVRWRLLPLLAVLVGVLWTFSILGLIGVDLSLVTISGLPILIGLGIDFAIQIHNRVEEEVAIDQDDHPIAETVANLAPPLYAAAFAGVVAFLALRLSKVPMIRDFGVLLAIGVVVLVTVGIILPAALLGIRAWKQRTGERDASLVERIVVKLGGLPTGFGVGLVVVSVFLFVGGILVEGRTKIQSDPVKWIDQGSQVVEDIDFLEERTNFSSTLGVLVNANNVYDQAVIDLVHEFTLDAEAHPGVVTTSSLVGTMAKIIEVPAGSTLAPSVDDVVAAGAVMPPDIATALVSPDQTATQVNLRLAPASLEQRAVLVDELKADLDARIAALDLPADSILLVDLAEGQTAIRATPAGLATVGIGLLDNLSANRAALTYLALCLAGLFLVLRFRSFSRGLLALVPVFLAVGASSLIVGLLGIELSPLTTVSGPLVIASCTEFSVLILGRYLEERQRGLEPRPASDKSAARTGRAFFTSACTTIGGFAVLMLSPLPLLRDFGLVVTLNVAIALLAALIVMPPMMVWADIKGWLGTQRQEGRAGSVRLAADMPSEQTVLAGVGVLVFAGAGVGVYASADTSTGESSEVAYAAVPLPTTTTTTTTTTVPPTTTTTTTVPASTVPGQTAPSTTEVPETTLPAGPVVDPSGFPDEPPAGAIAPTLHQLLTDQGVAPNVATCAVSTAYSRVDEATLMEMGLVEGNQDALDVVTTAATDCGIEPEVVDAAIASVFG